MTSISSQTAGQKITGDKSIPDHIIDGSIVIDSVEAFKSILKQYPENAALLKAYSDFLTKSNLFDLAAKSYGEASDLFIKGEDLTGNCFQEIGMAHQAGQKNRNTDFPGCPQKGAFQ